MGGAIIQLAAYGAQDIYLTGQPQITFFKAVYKSYTNFAMESILQSIDGLKNFGTNISCVISRNGDLLGRIMLEVEMPDLSNVVFGGDNDYNGWVQSIGNYLVESTSIEIGGEQMDLQTGKWMDIWSELSCPSTSQQGYGKMVGRDYTVGPHVPYNLSGTPGNRLYIPLNFWFCRNPGLALPLIALQYHDVKLRITISKLEDLLFGVKNGEYSPVEIIGCDPSIKSFKLYSTYFFLDTSERRKFTQNAHEYLIEQLQTQEGNVQNINLENNIKINISHPTKEIVVVFNRQQSDAPLNDFSIGENVIPNGTVKQFAPLYNFKLSINGHDRFTYRNGEYFRLVQPYEHHTNIPTNYIYSYSFALKPEDYQPSGTSNFSRIDNSYIVFNFRNNIPNSNGNSDGDVSEEYSSLPKFTLYAPCYNILRIMGGMAGLAYSN